MLPNSEVAGNRVALAEPATSVSRQRELNAVGNGDFPGVPDKVTAYC